MKYVRYIFILLLFAGMAACSKPKTIPDKTLVDIFSDLYLTNSFSERQFINFDSMDIYEPVFEHYGYSAQDFMHTMDEYSRRKSSRVVDIVDQAIAKLDGEYAVFAEIIRRNNVIDSLATEMFKQTVYTDSLIEVRKIADTSRLSLTFPAEAGTYEIHYYSTLDSLDKNNSLQNRFTLLDSLGNRLNQTSTRMYANSVRTRQKQTLTSSATASQLSMTFGNYPDKNMKKPYLTIDSIVLLRFIPIEEARARFYYTMPLKKKLTDSIRYGLLPPQDSSTLHLLPPLAPARRDSLFQ